MTNGQLSKTVTFLGGVGSVLLILGMLLQLAKDQGAMQSKLDATATDVALIKAKLIPDAKAATGPYIENADGPAEAVAEHPGGWQVAYLADHCKHCPECCPRVGTEALP